MQRRIGTLQQREAAVAGSHAHAQAERLVSTRQFAHFRTLSDAGKVVPDAAGDLNETLHSVNSRFFEIHGRLRLDQTTVEERSLLQRDGGAPRMLVVSMYPEDQYAVKALRAGASGYVNKSAGSDVLIEAIRQVGQGRKYISPTVATLLVDQIAAPERMLPHERLSEREQQLLVMIAGGQPLADIARQLDLAPKSVSVYRARLMEKMKLGTQAELVHYAMKHGLLQPASA